jgi:hypothetical protein
MTPASSRILAGLLLEELSKGTVRFSGTKLLNSAGMEVVPELSFVSDRREATSTPSPGLRVVEGDESVTKRNMAPPKSVMLPAKGGDRYEQSRQAAAAMPIAMQRDAARFQWPTNLAPLPEPKLVKRAPK